MIGPAPSLPEMATALQRYLDENAVDLAPWKVEPPDFDGKLDVLRALQARLFDDGWARYGWPEEIGGLGGDIRHRMLLIDLLEQHARRWRDSDFWGKICVLWRTFAGSREATLFSRFFSGIFSPFFTPPE